MPGYLGSSLKLSSCCLSLETPTGIIHTQGIHAGIFFLLHSRAYVLANMGLSKIQHTIWANKLKDAKVQK